MNPSKIKKSFGHKLIGSKYMKKMVIKTLQNLPSKIVNYIIKTTWFVSSFEDSWAFALRGDELKRHEFLIFLADDLLGSSESQITWTITHEIGHVVLGHRNSIGEVQSKSEIRRQEKEADEFAKKYLEE